MTDLEFEVLDELYFVQSFSELKELSGLEEARLQQTLRDLFRKGWVRCMPSRANDDQLRDAQQFPENYQQYYFLASKAGLLAHNSR